MLKTYSFHLVIFFSLLVSAPAWATIELPAIFTDNMVLQQKTAAAIWGKSDPGREVSLITSWNKQRYVAQADAAGKWRMVVETPKAGGPYSISISDGEELKLNNVLIGEVWICSGQSNMDFSLSGWTGNNSTGFYQKEIDESVKYSRIRLLQLNKMLSKTPQEDLVKGVYGGGWRESSPETLPAFSAVGYLFGRQLYEHLDVPIGIIYGAWGGSGLFSWTSGPIIETVPEYSEVLKKTRNAPEPDMSVKKPGCNFPTYLFNGMIHPLTGYSIRGVVWYQGEHDTWERKFRNSYKHLFPLMIQGWREAWKNDFPFYYVQLPNFVPEDSTGRAGLPIIRDAQLQTLRLEKTGMAVTVDIGDPKDIHPKDKREVSRRLALWALAQTYGKKITCSGPIYESYQLENGQVRIRFTHTDKGLVARDGDTLKGFTIAGVDGVEHPAEAHIEGNTVVVRSSEVKNPLSVRYAWEGNPDCNLYNGANLPASPFKTDN
jgi:sialate O-acetylesterase